MPRLLIQLWLACVALGMLVACGASNTRSAPTQSAGVATSATSAPSDAAPTKEAVASLLNGIPTSQTPEGYHVLGRPDAPLSIEFFSDFL